MDNFSEADLYEPVKRFFSSLGYAVNGEVRGCDLVASKDGTLVIVELKKSINLTLIFQAMERQKMSSQVYIAVPRPKNPRNRQFRNTLELVGRLGLGLISVAMDSPVKTVEILCFPPLSEKTKSPRKRALLLKEANGRSFDLNKGGSTRKKLLTAYRERIIKLACALELEGVCSPSLLIKKYGCTATAQNDLRLNVYGWFIRPKRGEYCLSATGKTELSEGEFPEVVEHYRRECLAVNGKDV